MMMDHQATQSRNNKLTLTDLKADFMRWRRDPHGSKRIPEVLWDKVIEILKYTSQSRVLSALGIGKSQFEQKLKKRAAQNNPQSSSPDKHSEQQHFVRALAAAPIISTSTKPATLALGFHDVVLTRANGATLQIQKLPYSDMIQLVSQFIG